MQDPMQDFDLDKYLRASKRVDLTGIRWDLIRQHPLRPEEARCLAYMMDIESHTVIFLRDLLATRAASDPHVSAFLSCWVYEELWHGEAFSRFLGEAGWSLAPDHVLPGVTAAYPSRVERNGWIRSALAGRGHVSHLATLIGSALMKDFVAIHMTWGAVNELSTLTGYERLIATTDHPILVELLKRIIKDERRHFAFYRAQARMRLGAGTRTARIVRWAMEHLWAPVGTGVRPQAETDFVISYLLQGNDGLAAARDMDATIREWPGFSNAKLIESARTAAIRRSTPAATTRSSAISSLAARFLS